MKRFLAVLLIAVLMLSTLAACNIDQDKFSTNPTQSTTSSQKTNDYENGNGTNSGNSGDENVADCTHIDEDKDHSCDKCRANVGAHEDGENDGDHNCDYCGKAIRSCADANKDHICDECGDNLGTHYDNPRDGDHKCDYCEDILTTCDDANKDHTCDDCGATVGKHADSTNDGDHLCDYCEETLTICVDVNNNHICDECGAPKHNYVNSTCSICGLARTDKKITFGSYPQSEVTDGNLKSTLNTKAGTLPSSSDSQKWTSYGYYIEGEVRNFMWYIDMEEGSEKYRGVYFVSYRPSNISYTSSESKSEQDDNGYLVSTVYWFKYEPISWTILEENTTNGTALILCDMIIDAQEYYIGDGVTVRTIDGKTVRSNNYEHSTIRKWLNETFYNTAFNELQQQIIVTATVKNDLTSTGESSNQFVCNNTNDKVFLLSVEETIRSKYGFSTSKYNSDIVRQKIVTDYAKSQGVVTNTTPEYNGRWWLRSPGNMGPSNACNIMYNGSIDTYASVSFTYMGVVPALQIKL